jgi:hypothetical protein
MSQSTDKNDEYVLYAAHCLEMAKLAQDAGSLGILNDMATEWLRLADAAVPVPRLGL